MYTDTTAVVSKVYARAGLLGNPSDGFFGKTISLSVANFWAEVTLQPAAGVSFEPHPQHDPLDYPSLQSLSTYVRGNGYYGGVRLMMAMCKCFLEHCTKLGIPVETSRGFKMRYDTNIPRQAGLSGSSAICTAALNCLLKYYGLESRVPLPERPALLLCAEEELGITAGLQDRVIQVYGGLVYMDFDKGLMHTQGRGEYTSLDPALLPPLHLMYMASGMSGKDSGQVHSDVRRRWQAGEEEVVRGMQEVAELAEAGRGALERRDYAALAQLMRKNFAMRRRLFGDAVVGAANLRMVALAESVGAAAKLPGSGGAVLVYCPDGESQVARLRDVCERAAQGYVLVSIEVGATTIAHEG